LLQFPPSQKPDKIPQEAQESPLSQTTMSDAEYLKNLLGVHPDFPQKGINFLDIFPILRDPVAFDVLITNFVHHLTSHTIPSLSGGKIDVVVSLDARGFLFGPIIASRLKAAFVPVRKKGKLPGKCLSAEYEKEYGKDVFEMQTGAIKPGQTVVIIDDLVATGGSAAAAGELVAKQGGVTIEYLFIIEATFLNPQSKLDAPVYSIIQAGDNTTVDSAPACRPSADYLTSLDVPGDLSEDDPGAFQKIASRKRMGLGKGERNSSEQL